MHKETKSFQSKTDKTDFKSRGRKILHENSKLMEEYAFEEPNPTTIPQIDLSDFKETWEIIQSKDTSLLKSIYGADKIVPLEPIIEPLSPVSSLNQAGENLLKFQKKGIRCQFDPNIRPYEIFRDNLVPILKNELSNTFEDDRNQHFWHSIRIVKQTLKDIERLPLKEIDLLTYQSKFNDSISSIIRQMEQLKLIPPPLKYQDLSKPIPIMASEEARRYFSDEAQKSRDHIFSQAIQSGLFKFQQMPVDLQNEYQSFDKDHVHSPIDPIKTKPKKTHKPKSKSLPKKLDSIDDVSHILQLQSKFLNLPTSYKPKISDSFVTTSKTIKLSPVEIAVEKSSDVVTPQPERNLKEVEVITRPFNRQSTSLREKKTSLQNTPTKTIQQQSQDKSNQNLASSSKLSPNRSIKETKKSPPDSLKPKRKIALSPISQLTSTLQVENSTVLKEESKSPKKMSLKTKSKKMRVLRKSKMKSKSGKVTPLLSPSKVQSKSSLDTPISSFPNSPVITPRNSILDFDSLDIDHALTYACNTPSPMSGIPSRNGSALNTSRPLNSYENRMKRGIFWRTMGDPLEHRSGKYVDQLMLLQSLSDIPLDLYTTQAKSTEEEYEPFKMISRPQSPPQSHEFDDDPEWQPTPFDLEPQEENHHSYIETIKEDVTKEEAVQYLKALNVEVESEEIGTKTYDRLNEIWANFGFTIQERMGMIAKYTESMNMITRFKEILSVWESLFSLFNSYEHSYKSFIAYMKIDVKSMNNKNSTLSNLYMTYKEAEEKLEAADGILKTDFGSDDLLIKGKRISDYIAIHKSKTERMMKQIGFDPD